MRRFLAATSIIAWLAILPACSKSQETAKADTPQQSAAADTAIERLDPALDTIIPPGAVLEKVAGGIGFAEGPVWVHDRLRFSDLTGNKLYEITPEGKLTLLLDKSGGLDNPPPGSFKGSNGAVVDKDGTVLMTQHGARRIVRLDDSLKITPVIERIDGKRLNSPNDMVFASDGALWITDPPYGLTGQDKDPAKEAPHNAVYRYKNGVLKAMITDLPRPNGVGFSPDGKKLYISNCEPEMFVNVYDVAADGTVSGGRTFIKYPGPHRSMYPTG